MPKIIAARRQMRRRSTSSPRPPIAASEIVVVMPTTNRKNGKTRSATLHPFHAECRAAVDGVMVARVVDEQHPDDGEAAKCIEAAPSRRRRFCHHCREESALASRPYMFVPCLSAERLRKEQVLSCREPWHAGHANHNFLWALSPNCRQAQRLSDRASPLAVWLPDDHANPELCPPVRRALRFVPART